MAFQVVFSKRMCIPTICSTRSSTNKFKSAGDSHRSIVLVLTAVWKLLFLDGDDAMVVAAVCALVLRVPGITAVVQFQTYFIRSNRMSGVSYDT